MAIRWCLGLRLGGDWVMFGWLNEIGVCSLWVWDLLTMGLGFAHCGFYFFFLGGGFAHNHAL